MTDVCHPEYRAPHRFIRINTPQRAVEDFESGLMKIALLRH